MRLRQGFQVLVTAGFHGAIPGGLRAKLMANIRDVRSQALRLASRMNASSARQRNITFLHLKSDQGSPGSPGFAYSQVNRDSPTPACKGY